MLKNKHIDNFFLISNCVSQPALVVSSSPWKKFVVRFAEPLSKRHIFFDQNSFDRVLYGPCSKYDIVSVKEQNFPSSNLKYKSQIPGVTVYWIWSNNFWVKDMMSNGNLIFTRNRVQGLYLGISNLTVFPKFSSLQANTSLTECSTDGFDWFMANKTWRDWSKKKDDEMQVYANGMASNSLLHRYSYRREITVCIIAVARLSF